MMRCANYALTSALTNALTAAHTHSPAYKAGSVRKCAQALRNHEVFMKLASQGPGGCDDQLAPGAATPRATPGMSLRKAWGDPPGVSLSRSVVFVNVAVGNGTLGHRRIGNRVHGGFLRFGVRSLTGWCTSGGEREKHGGGGNPDRYQSFHVPLLISAKQPVCTHYPLRAACGLPTALHEKCSKVNKAGQTLRGRKRETPSDRRNAPRWPASYAKAQLEGSST